MPGLSEAHICRSRWRRFPFRYFFYATNTWVLLLFLDYIIVGGGLAGCVLASRIHQSSRSSVILLEAGPDQHQNPLITNPFGSVRIPETDLIWRYKTVPQTHLNDRVIDSYSGRLLSGSSAVNHGGWTRGHAADYDLWAELVGDDRWSYNGLLPYFRRSEHFHGPMADTNQVSNLYFFCFGKVSFSIFYNVEK
jgi:choline dehydrogenase-like flavoprotein